MLITTENLRADLGAAGLLVHRPVVVTLLGSPGCGKTEIIAATARLLAGRVRLGVVLANGASPADLQRLRLLCPRVMLADAKPSREPLGHGLGAWADGDEPELVLIEEFSANPDSATSGPQAEWDATLRVGVFSVAAGDDKAARDPARLQCADLLLLTKVDLLEHVPFDLQAFKSEVSRRSAARLLEISPRSGSGMDGWVHWLCEAVDRRRPAALAKETLPECFLG